MAANNHNKDRNMWNLLSKDLLHIKMETKLLNGECQHTAPEDLHHKSAQSNLTLAGLAALNALLYGILLYV